MGARESGKSIGGSPTASLYTCITTPAREG